MRVAANTQSRHTQRPSALEQSHRVPAHQRRRTEQGHRQQSGAATRVLTTEYRDNRCGAEDSD
jgi:hypothetical protein